MSLIKAYLSLLNDIKEKIETSRLRAAFTLNKEVINLYWYIGKQIITKQKDAAWGDGVLDNLSKDLRKAFPEMRGFSKTNLKYMRILAHFYPDGIGQHPVDQLPWGHIMLLMRIKENDIRHWYVRECLSQGWSRPTLENKIQQNLYVSQTHKDNKASNYLDRLPHPQSLFAQEILKNPYNFDFLGLHDDALEREIEYAASTKHIVKFLLELGKGFAFVGTQVPVEVNEHEFFIDMLFYNLKLHCYFVIEIKATSFKPEHTGQLNFYLSAVDDLIKAPEDNPSIGLLLCKSRDKVIAEYSLKSIEKPIGVSEYKLIKSIPEKLQTSLPSIKEIEDELNRNFTDQLTLGEAKMTTSKRVATKASKELVSKKSTKSEKSVAGSDFSQAKKKNKTKKKK
jgi:predicted nuclease of restriction endonuclease-like (RecB) superfamily